MHQLSDRLLQACSDGDYASVKECIEKGERLDIADECCMTPMMVALGRGYVQIAQLLLEAEPRMSLQESDANGQTALMQAVSRFDIKSVEFLISAGADIDCTNYYGYSALDMAKDSREFGMSEIRSLLESKKSRDEYKHLVGHIGSNSGKPAGIVF